MGHWWQLSYKRRNGVSMSSSTDRSNGVLSGPDSKAIACRGISSGVLVGLGLVAATHVLEVDGGRTVIKLGYAVVAGLAVGEVTIGHRVHYDDGSTTQSKSCRSRRAVGATIGMRSEERRVGKECRL